MKKSQILAALALAFALGLGVVAPAANTYAAFSQNTTAEQKTEINNAMAVVDADAAEIEGLTDYETVYDSIETSYTNAAKGVREKLTSVLNAERDAYNAGPAATTSTLNGYIKDAATKHGLAFRDSNLANEAVRPDATPVALTALSNASDAYAAIADLKALVANATNNQDILSKNYDSSKPAVSDLDTIYTNIINSANYWIGTIESNINTNFTVAVPTATGTFGKAFKAIDEAAWNTLTTSKAWTDAAANTNTEKAVKWGMIIDAAAQLPKYRFVPAVEAAKANYEKITGAVAVDYGTAKDYIAAYVKALNDFKNGVATTTPTDPATPGTTTPDGSNNGSDDTKDPSAPGTGLVGTAEGNAATTVSIVAGLATALTALGAGVVAYRSARRSNK